ncbi:hypothetical protein IE53DRAFT_377113 [Violaceomyces palustris]|uniref:Uncharacterized protein n=1 Tax=Violaceomyces palustris TaxID=1673888 RepID=A0ACD0P6R2_9BASI|nr:hypothetical protein IE53DRAFT_377113 [Violaceomyces palustris]
MTSYRYYYRRKPDKDKVIAGYKAALNNPNTTKEGRSHARKQLILKGRFKEAFTSRSLSTRIRSALGLRAKRRR